MRKTACWLIVAILALQVSLSGQEISTKDNFELNDGTEEVTNFAGRQGSMNGNVTGEPDCNFTNWQNSADGLGGPVWQSGGLYEMYSIVEWPANSGEFYQTTLNTTASPEDGPDHWEGPCTCDKIGEHSGIVWDSNSNYNPWQVVFHDSGYWIAQDAGTQAGDEPEIGNENWVQCSEGQQPSGDPCEGFNGYGGMPWTNSTLVTTGEIYEFPAGSGVFHAVAPGFSNQTVGAPGSDFQSWSKDNCSCEDIWEAASNPVWDSSIGYTVGALVEYPTGTGDIWMALVSQTTTGIAPDQPFADGNEWELCVDEAPASGPCGGLTSVGVWDNLSRVSTGEIYQFPAGSGDYYEVIIQGYLDQEVSSPTIDLDVWAPVDCPCEEEWVANGEPVWDASTTYATNSVVEWPSGSSMLYIAWASPGPGDEPGTDPEWELCSSSDEPSGEPCAGLTVVGVWNSSMNVTSGEIYEYPANSQTYYQVNQGGPFTNVNAPDLDMDVWSPIDCPCEETWVANGQPVWDSSEMYWTNEVVEWPAGSGTLWIALDNQAGLEPTSASIEWEQCSDPTIPSGEPCAGLNVVGVWSTGMNVTSGDVYEYPTGSDTYYQVNPGSPFWSVSAPDIDMDVWSPIDCPCKETWVANGQPVWDVSTTYYQEEVVEWPVGSGTLWMALDNGFDGSEPTLTAGDWEHCDDSYPPASEPCAGLEIVGVWSSGMNVTSGEIYEYPANSEHYYQVNQGGPFTNANAPDVDMDVWSPIDCPCKETWVANGQPVWDSSQYYYSGNYVVEWPAGSSNLYMSEGGGLTGAGEPGVDTHWTLCAGEGPSPGPCDGLDVPVWDNTTGAAVGDIYEFPANSGTYFQIIFVHDALNGGPGWVADPIMDGGADEFWEAYSCPCKTTWVANGQPVWDDTISMYSGNYVVEWPAGSGTLYISEAGGLSASVEPGTDGHWIPCEGNPESDDDVISISEPLPSIGVALTLVGVLSAAGLISRSKRQ